MAQLTLWRWTLGLGLAALLAGVPFLYYRYDYTYAKRLREVDPGRVYRSGQMTAPGFQEAVVRLGIHTIINLQNEYPDPDIALGYFTGQTIKESALCRQLGVRYVFIDPDLISRRRVPAAHPQAIDQILKILDDPASYPVLLHCRAGLHRTGIMTAVYRMEYQGWSPRHAIAELKANGFSEWQCSSANDYVTQYVLTYHPRAQRSEVRGQRSEVRGQRSEVGGQKSEVGGQKSEEGGVRGRETRHGKNMVSAFSDL